jgi:hypothetical protein
MRSKAHTAPTAPLGLHRTRIGKYAMKKFYVYQWPMTELTFLIVTYSFGATNFTAHN